MQWLRNETRTGSLSLLKTYFELYSKFITHTEQLESKSGKKTPITPLALAAFINVLVTTEKRSSIFRLWTFPRHTLKIWVLHELEHWQVSLTFPEFQAHSVESRAFHLLKDLSAQVSMCFWKIIVWRNITES